MAIIPPQIRSHSLKSIIKAKSLLLGCTMGHIENSMIFSFWSHIHSIVWIHSFIFHTIIIVVVFMINWHTLCNWNRKLFYFVYKSSLNMWQNCIFIYVIIFFMIFIKNIFKESLIKWICTCFFFTIFLLLVISIRHLGDHRIMLSF